MWDPDFQYLTAVALLGLIPGIIVAKNAVASSPVAVRLCRLDAPPTALTAKPMRPRTVLVIVDVLLQLARIVNCGNLAYPQLIAFTTLKRNSIVIKSENQQRNKSVLTCPERW
jgi:hypothetical protein